MEFSKTYHRPSLEKLDLYAVWGFNSFFRESVESGLCGGFHCRRNNEVQRITRVAPAGGLSRRNALGLLAHPSADPCASERTPIMKSKLLASIALGLALITSTQAQTNNYIDGNGKWETSNSWSRSVAPSTNDIADVITGTNRITITIDSTTAGSFPSSMIIKSLILGANTLQLTNVGTVSFNILNQFFLTNGASLLNDGGTFNITGPVEIDQGTLTSASGTTQLSSNLLVAVSDNSTGTVNVTGGQLVATNGIISIGNDGTITNGLGVGTMTVSNATVLANTMLLGSCVGGQATLNILTNGLVHLVGSNAMLVADTGTVTIPGGQLISENGVFPVGQGGTDTINISGGTLSCQTLYVGVNNYGTVNISAGQMTVSSSLIIGGTLSSGRGTVPMTGGKLIANVLTTIVGDYGVGTLTLATGSTATFSKLVIGENGGSGWVYVKGGTLNVPAANIIINAGTCSLCPSAVIPDGIIGDPGIIDSNGCSPIVSMGSNTIGQLTISNGMVNAGGLVLTNGDDSQFAFPGGTLSSGYTVVSNNQLFLVGDGTDAATFVLDGGVHSFANNLELANNGTLSGCGTIEGNAVNDTGGVVVVSCGTLTFTGIVTNNGTMLALDGNVLQFDGAVVNDGVIDALSGGVIFNSTLAGSGVVLTSNCVPTITAIQKVVTDIHVTFTTCTNGPYTVEYETNKSFNATGPWMTLTNVTGTGGTMTVTDSGGATNHPSRYYHVGVVTQ